MHILVSIFMMNSSKSALDGSAWGDLLTVAQWVYTGLPMRVSVMGVVCDSLYVNQNPVGIIYINFITELVLGLYVGYINSCIFKKL